MKRKSTIATKVKKVKLFIKDPKILNYYKKFRYKIFKDVKYNNFALDVSVGPDSLCLAYFAKLYSS